MRIASELASFSLGEADILRKAMGKKKADVMQAQRQKFMNGATARGIGERKAGKIFDLMEHFAGYGFNKSHSTAYALLAYQTAYLKANYPWYFAASLLTIESQNTEKLAMYLAECRERRIPVLPPDINQSQVAFTVVPEGVRFGLAAVKNVGEGAINSILSVRAARGRISSLHALCEELDLRLVNKRVLESLVKAGALDSLGAHRNGGQRAPGPDQGAFRARLMASIDAACDHGTRRQRDRDLGQAQLFAGPAAQDAGGESDELPAQVRPWTEAEQLAYEKEALGFYWSGHPIDRVAAELRAFGARTTADLAASLLDGTPLDKPGEARANRGAQDAGNPTNGAQRRSSGADVSVGGIVSACRQLKTRKGDRMAVITLEDSHGSVEVVVFPEAYGRASSLLEAGKAVVVCGRVERDEEAETLRMLASEVLPLEAMRERMARAPRLAQGVPSASRDELESRGELSIRLTVPPHGRATFEALADLFASHRGDRRVVFELELRGRDRPLRVRAEVASPIKIRPSDQLAAEVERICGAGTVSLR